MIEYKIVSKDSEKILNLSDLSRNLKVDSEIFSIENDKEILLGFISHKTLVYLSSEFAYFAYQNYAKNQDLRVENCINLTKNWIKDQSSLSKEELSAAAVEADAAATNDDTAAAYTANAAYSAAAAANADDAAAYAANAAYSAYAAADAAYSKQEEFIRQGEFILDYLKSGLYLFHLGK